MDLSTTTSVPPLDSVTARPEEGLASAARFNALAQAAFSQALAQWKGLGRAVEVARVQANLIVQRNVSESP